MKKIVLLSILSVVVVNCVSLVVFAKEQPKEDLMQIIRPFMPVNSSLISPEKPFSTKSVQFYDFNRDGQKEIIFTYEIKAQNQPAPSQFGAIVLKKTEKDWQKTWETSMLGVSLDFSGLKDITGDGIKEYLFGVTIGASIGSELEIFQSLDSELTKIAETPYHKMEFVEGTQNVAIAVWHLYIGDSYLVEVLKWNGEKLTNDEASYARYYPIIENFYVDKIAQIDTWFYWYCLADAQIHANKLKDAYHSIQEGTAIAKASAMQEVIQYFKELTDRLENKKINASLFI
ncbi:hypothetical protein ACIQXI_05430 [Lysinibacillus sp. NPDC097195]|uniref:hypothetical protein n=1 Tax=Lysinibacillus sp. NPDC097195 TaxID=3364141 RepID=UPI00381A385C